MKNNYNILLASMGLNIGGAETHIVELAKGLRQEGFNIIVASNGGIYEKELLENGIKHYRVPLHNKNPYNIIRSYLLLKRIIIAESIDLVHAHARIPAFVCGLLNKKIRFPFITSAHGVFETGWGLKYITNWGQKTIAVSEDIREYLMKSYSVGEENIRLTVNGINTEKFSPDMDCSDIKKEFGLSDDSIHIVSISRLDSGTSEVAFQLVDIVPELVKEIKSLDVIIVGSGSLYNQVREKAERINEKLGRRVIIMTGGRTDVNKFTAIAHLFIGISRSALEAMASARPVILAGNPGYMGILSEEKFVAAINNNFTCRGEKKSNTGKLKNDILMVLTGMDDRQREQLGSAGKKVILENYSIERMVRDNIDVYLEFLHGAGEYSRPHTHAEDRVKGKYDVIISGYYGTKNSGDDAILMAIINNLRIYKQDIRIMVLSKNPAETKAVYGVDSISRVNLFNILWAMHNAKLFVYGGGSIIQDITSTRSLIYYLSTIWLAKRMGLKVMLYANGIGPVNRHINRILTSEIVNRVDVITIREELSRRELERLGIDRPRIMITADPALTIEAVRDKEIDQVFVSEGIHPDGPYIGISVREWKGHKKYEKIIAQVADYMTERYGIKTVFIPMHYPKDLAIIESIVSKMRCRGYIIKNKYDVSYMMGIVRKMEVLIGMRLHSLIYAAKLGIPVIGLVYEPKVEGFLQYIHQMSAGHVEDLEYERLKSIIDDVWGRRTEIRGQLQEITVKLKEKALQDARTAIELIG